MPRFDIRISKDLAGEVERAVSQRGFESTTAFIRQAISNELRFGGSALREVEERIAASQERLSREIRRVQTAQQAAYAVLDTFVRVFLMCVPEPSGDAVTPAKARAATRYGNFVKNVARNMTGDARAALAELIEHD
jgi:Arc/MetJ-type ribon-helix-helix transcriptional regulator